MTPDDLDRIRAQYTGAHRCDPPGSVAADVRTLLAALDAERARAERAEAEAIKEQERREHGDYWYGCRWERLRDLLRGTEYESRAAQIMANGTVHRMPDGSIVCEPPTYAQQFNRMMWQVEAAEKASDEARRAAIGECIEAVESLRKHESSIGEDRAAAALSGAAHRLRALLTAPASAGTPRT